MAELVFDGQREGEKVKFIFRRHMATMQKGWNFFWALVIIGIIPMFLWQNDVRMFWLFLACLVVALLGLAYAYMRWYFSIYIVTNERLRQISQKGFFKKSVVDLSLDKIESISYGVPGIMGGIFGYGTILIQTGVGDLTISMVGKPEKIYNKLQNVMKKVKDEEDEKE